MCLFLETRGYILILDDVCELEVDKDFGAAGKETAIFVEWFNPSLEQIVVDDIVDGDFGSFDESCTHGIVLFKSEDDVWDIVGTIDIEGFVPLGIWALVFYYTGSANSGFI